jgi:hypothetical protein
MGPKEVMDWIDKHGDEIMLLAKDDVAELAACTKDIDLFKKKIQALMAKVERIRN